MKRVVLLFLLLCFIKLPMMAQEDMFKALFMYNFTKNIEWPESYKQGDFVIGVLGNSPIISELNKIASRKKAGSQTIVVKKFGSANDISQCHILFLPTNKSTSLSDVIEKLKSTPTLIITDKEGLAKQGAALNFIKVDGKQKFEINKINIENSTLKVNSYLVSLGIEVK